MFVFPYPAHSVRQGTMASRPYYSLFDGTHIGTGKAKWHPKTSILDSATPPLRSLRFYHPPEDTQLTQTPVGTKWLKQSSTTNGLTPVRTFRIFWNGSGKAASLRPSPDTLCSTNSQLRPPARPFWRRRVLPLPKGEGYSGALPTTAMICSFVITSVPLIFGMRDSISR